MKVIKSFILIILLISSGLLQCTSLRLEKKRKLGRLWRNRLLLERPERSRAIGIHLGTSYSRVAVYKHPAAFDMRYCLPLNHGCAASSFYDTMEVVADEQGNTALPTCVAFTDDSGVLIGEAAKAQESVNSERTICGINRLFGKKFDDPEFQGYIKTLPYKVVNKENKPHIEVQFKNGEIKLYSPEEICSMILGKMKEIAATYMGNEAKNSVIIISGSHIDNEVKQQVMEACDIARLKNRYVGTSTQVVALLRDFYRDISRVLIFDLGGSAFSAIILDYDEGVYLRMAAKEDTHLGGQTFDTRLVDYYVSVIKSKYKKDISKNLVALAQLRSECEKAKISLSSSDRVIIKVQFSLVDDEILIFEEILTRETFEELNIDLFNKTMNLVKGALEEGKLNKTDIDEIVLVGGSTEIPMIRHLVKNYFEKEPLNVVNPKEVLAFAATQFAGGYLTSTTDSCSNMVVPNSMRVGIETIGGVMTRLYPSISLIEVTTYYDGQTTIDIKVFEGRVPFTKDCHYLGNLQISNLPPAPRGVTTIDVIVEVYGNRSINVTAEHEATRNTKSIFISNEERYNNDETVVQEYDHDEFMDREQKIRDMYREDTRKLQNVLYAMSVVHPQPRSMGFAPVNIRDSIRFHPQVYEYGFAGRNTCVAI